MKTSSQYQKSKGGDSIQVLFRFIAGCQNRRRGPTRVGTSSSRYDQSSFTRALLCSLIIPSPEDLIVWFGNLLLSEDPLRTIQELGKTTQRQEDTPIILECHCENMDQREVLYLDSINTFKYIKNPHHSLELFRLPAQDSLLRSTSISRPACLPRLGLPT